jgi:coenzyme F420-dependent glucose-6-phosphate dehydrogenase
MGSTNALGSPDRLELGYWLSSEEHPPGALVDHAVNAERAGFRTAMISDHFAPWIPLQGNSPFVWSVLGGIANATASLRVGTGVSAPVHRMHPLVIAHAAATVEVMMPGRFFLGLGAGERLNEHVMGERWPTPKERRSMLREAIGLIRDLWSGKTVSRRGKHFTVEHAGLFTRPDTPPPIVVAAGGKRAAKLAGEEADGVLGVAPTPDVVDAFEAAGGTGKPRLAQLHVCWAQSECEARQIATRWWPNAAISSPLLTELALPTQFEAAAEHVTEDMVAKEVVCGPDVERHAAAIQRFVAAGFTTIYLHQIGPDQLGFLEFCRRELLPQFARDES